MGETRDPRLLLALRTTRLVTELSTPPDDVSAFSPVATFTAHIAWPLLFVDSPCRIATFKAKGSTISKAPVKRARSIVPSVFYERGEGSDDDSCSRHASRVNPSHPGFHKWYRESFLTNHVGRYQIPFPASRQVYPTQIRFNPSVSAALRCFTSAVMKGMFRPEAAWNVRAEARCRASSVLSPVFWASSSA